MGINGGHTLTFFLPSSPYLPSFSCFPLFPYTMAPPTSFTQRSPILNRRGRSKKVPFSGSPSPPANDAHQLGSPKISPQSPSPPMTVVHLLGSSRISLPVSSPTGPFVAHGPDRKPDPGPLVQGATIHLRKVSPHDLLGVLSSSPRCPTPWSPNWKSPDPRGIRSSSGNCNSSSSDSSSDEGSSVRGVHVSVRQDLLFGPSTTGAPASNTKRVAAVRRHQAFMISKALDACTLPTPVEDYLNKEAHREFMEDVRQRQSDPKNPGYMSSGDQARRDAIFMAARASGD